MSARRFLTCLWLAMLLVHCGKGNPAGSKSTLPVSLDAQGPYLILASPSAAMDYERAIDLAKQLHPGAVVRESDLGDSEAVKSLLDRVRPHYALVFLRPGELDVQLAWRWLQWSSSMDGDPFIDVRTGFMTGESPAAVLAMMERTRDALAGRLTLPAVFIDQLGPNSEMARQGFSKTPGSFMIPIQAGRFPAYTISHGREGFRKERLSSLSGAGLVHFGGHGYPDRVVDCLNGPYARRVPLSPCVVFSGACYTGVTGRWWDVSSGAFQPRQVPASLSFALGILANKSVGYLAALHADHGIPVYQEMEFLAYTGASLGNAIKHTLDGVIIASGGKPLPISQLAEGSPVSWTAAEFMLWGTASRVLFGDPALTVMEKFCDPPLAVRRQALPGAVRITATVQNSALKSTFSDTYYSDLSLSGTFNDRILISCPWPAAWRDIETPRIIRLNAQGRSLPCRLVGWAWETDLGKTLLQIQVDVQSTGFMRSYMREPGSEIEIMVQRRQQSGRLESSVSPGGGRESDRIRQSYAADAFPDGGPQ
jgi:hypothetical protein